MWEDLEAPEVDRRDVLQAREDTDRLIARVLGNEAGIELMALLRQWYVEPPVATPGSDASFAYFREGQRAVVQDLEVRLRRATHG